MPAAAAAARDPARLRDLPDDKLPALSDALRGLAAAHRRVAVSLVFRLLAVAFLIALLAARLPALRAALPLADALGVALILWPYYTALGRLYAWRIALGRRYADLLRHDDAAAVLAPVGGVWVALFDAQGEGRYHLALAYSHVGREPDARRLWRDLSTQNPHTEWGRRAASAAVAELPLSP